MLKTIGTAVLRKQGVPGVGEQPSDLPQAKRTSFSWLLVAWFVVMLPLGWGLYAAGETVAPLIRMLLSHNR